MCFLVCVFFLSSVAVQPSATNARDAISGEYLIDKWKFVFFSDTRQDISAAHRR